ncbi:SWIM zinc finger family protein [uncultured Imperialibacter sp.]|uniref:SWIM zinc finger family protein n=1 Tax=uncultured Imperialibacter sp. TaxID=1672639 RepID=UPI0030DD26B7|tara:strand:- start:14475 stop:15818 length:1344 start_codon:yes stop_codon:yes gene_type:complete
MSENITYSYQRPSALIQSGSKEELFLAQYNEVQKGSSPCFFWGKLNDPYHVSRCLITLSNVVRSSFSLSPFQLAQLKDPIVTSGNEKIRFEGFSHCASAYARVDVLPDGLDGEFLENGTTNVDFNQPMINALSMVKKQEKVLLSVGQKEVGIHREGEKVVERKVPLPLKWIKGLTTVQIYLADTEEGFSLSRPQALQLFKSIPKGKVKGDYFLIKRGAQYIFSPMASKDAICVGGVHRLRLLEQLMPLADKLRVFARLDMQSTTWQLYFGMVRFSLSLSRDPWRGFSGEGAALESLVEEIPETWVEKMDNYSYANQSFNPTLLAIEESLTVDELKSISSRMAAMGLLGFDLDDNEYFYRRLPFKTERILSLNPRLKGAEKLLEEDKVTIISKEDHRIEARVEGTGVHHTVLIQGEQSRCTCTWFAKHQGQRGVCKHILATKKKLLEQ